MSETPTDRIIRWEPVTYSRDAVTTDIDGVGRYQVARWAKGHREFTVKLDGTVIGTFPNKAKAMAAAEAMIRGPHKAPVIRGRGHMTDPYHGMSVVGIGRTAMAKEAASFPPEPQPDIPHRPKRFQVSLTLKQIGYLLDLIWYDLEGDRMQDFGYGTVEEVTATQAVIDILEAPVWAMEFEPDNEG